MSITNYKVVIIGDAGTGKTTYLNRLTTGAFTKTHIPTLGVDVNVLDFTTKHGTIVFNCWEIGGARCLDYFADKFLPGAQACLIFYDTSNLSTWDNIKHYIDKTKQQCPEIPIIICGNKIDIRERGIVANDGSDGIEIIFISAKSNYDFEKPFLTLARSLINDETLEFLPHLVEVPNITVINHDLEDGIQFEYENSS